MERRIEGATRLRAPADRALRALRTRGDVILGARASAAERHRALGLGPLHHEIILAVGPPRDAGNRVTRRVGWEAAMHPDVFPVFDGELSVERDEQGAAVLWLRGVYAVPFGPVGRFGDGVGGRRVARRCIAGFLDDIARRLDAIAEPLEPHDEPHRYAVEVADHSAALAS